MTTLSIIIPTLNEERSIARTLEAAQRVCGVSEIIVVDGGSGDCTCEIARGHDVKLLRAERGRGSQMHAGACVATGEVIWFLHADTAPPAKAGEQISAAAASREMVGGCFDVAFDGFSAAARGLTKFYRLWRKLGLAYGDSAIFVRAETYRRVGGFHPFPIFEDLDLVRRLKRQGRFVQLETPVVTSSRRFEGRSFALTFARWSLLQGLYWCGVHPDRLNRMYAPIRERGNISHCR